MARHAADRTGLMIGHHQPKSRAAHRVVVRPWLTVAVPKILLATLFLVVFWLPSTSARADQLTVYTTRNESALKPLFEAYTQETGVEIRCVVGKKEALLQRLAREGSKTPADLLILEDAGDLWMAAKRNLLQPVPSDTLWHNIPLFLRDPGHLWFGLSQRARVIVYHVDRVNPAELSTYQGLGNPKWKGRLLLQSSQSPANRSLAALMIAEYGSAATEQLLRSWKANLAQPPLAKDTDVLAALLAGKGDVGVVESDCYFQHQSRNQTPKLALFWPDQGQGGTGVHINIVGCGVTQHTRNRDAAVRLLEWLSAGKGQQLFAEANLEYPANPRVKMHPDLAARGAFRKKVFNLSDIGLLQPGALRLIEKSGYR